MVINFVRYNAMSSEDHAIELRSGKASNSRSRATTPVEPQATTASPKFSYTVTSRDTLTGLAARYNVTPSELCSFNKLTTRYIFPGQTLQIPIREQNSTGEPKKPQSIGSVAKREDTRPADGGSSTCDMDIIREEPALPESNPPVNDEEEKIKGLLDEEMSPRFLKINVRHITEGQGVIQGVLLITPNVIMFDPDVSDPLVVESGGPDHFGVVLPMDLIICSTIYREFGTHPIENDGGNDTAENQSSDRNRCPGVFFPPNYEALKQLIEKKKSEEHFLTENPFASAPSSNRSSFDNKENIDGRKASEESTNLSDRIRRTKSVRGERPDGTVRRRSLMKGISMDLRSKSESFDSSNLASMLRDTGSYGKQQGQQVLKRLSQPFAWMEESLSISSVPTPSLKSLRSPSKGESSIMNVFPKMSFGGSSTESVGELEANLPYEKPSKLKSLVQIGDFPELFNSFDEMITKTKSCPKNPPMYLHIQLGQPVDENGTKDKEKLKKSAVSSYGKRLLKPEYWFTVPSEKADTVCRFFLLWAPGIYGDPSEMDPSSRPGLEPLVDELNIADEENKVGLKHTISGIDFDSYVRDLIGDSEILDVEMSKALARKMPPRTEGCRWCHVFSTSEDGFSLANLYRKMSDVSSPTLLVIEDTKSHVFGALISCEVRISESFYGNGESFLFAFTPKLKTYAWTGENQYFVKGNNESLAVGAGDGRFGIWLDGDLYKGRSQSCATFGNPPLSDDEDFIVKAVECWTFPGS